MAMKLLPPLPPEADAADPYEDLDALPSDQEVADTQPRTNDLSNALACCERFGLNYRYAVEWACWLAWTGTHWMRTGAEVRLFADIGRWAQREFYFCKGRIAALEKETIEVAKKHGLGSPELSAVTEKIASETSLLKWFSASQNTAKIGACITQLRALCQVSFTALDRDPWLLNCTNGTIDLRTADLRDHDRADLITSCLEIDYDPDARAPTWDSFLAQCMHNERLLVLYLQRLVGYTLTATTAEHVLVFCYGDGSNGKSTFLRILQDLLGPYGCAMPRTLLFTSKPGEVHPTELATLYGRRLGVCSEVGEDAKLDEAKMKDLTGGDPISCRRMHEDFWTYRPTHTLWLAGNHRPTITGTDEGVWRRMRVVPWTVSFPREKQDKDLTTKLRSELPGILAWAVAGCLEWQRIGLADPPDSINATADYRTHADVVGDFFKLRLVFTPEGRMTAKALRTSYESWCDELGHLPVGARKLGARLRQHGVRPINVRMEGRFVNGWAGVRMLAEYEAPPDRV